MGVIIALMRALLPVLAFPIMMGAATLLAQTPPATKAPAKAPAKSPTAGPSARLLNPALAKAKAPDLYRVKFTTTKGDFVVEVNRADAPLGADRFYNLIKVGFFTNVSFFRVIGGALIQFHPTYHALLEAQLNSLAPLNISVRSTFRNYTSIL